MLYCLYIHAPAIYIGLIMK